ncbi:MAG TPA: SusC/RagA family TonB-linked outer membrane protein [Bacteroidales bacterium]|nr:SusC/RagA family TonB-linked outer membrane protein [Bacteroidales bacterium]HPT09029.1 SusC/RagA family TonB-linked outer membrane protein [Bacteroidales bacterium]
MRKFTILLALMLFIGMQVANAQRTITGKVTSSDDGAPIPGATILVKGTAVGAITDVDGKYSLTVPKDNNTLLVSYVGMKTQELVLGTDNVVNVVLQPSIQELEGVVVTALGVTREKKALGYSVQDVKGGALQTDGSANVINSLSGRVAGVQVTSATGNMAGSSRILIRGINSISGNNQPLFVIDGTIIDNSDFNTTNTARGAGGFDYGNMAQDINPDDIADISVLKGANAAALYGSRAANGVILITTKKGEQKKGKQIGIEFNTGLSFEQVSYLPKYQYDYGGGNGGLDATWEVKYYNDNSGYYKVPGTDPDGNPYQSFDLGMDYGIDESFGPAYATTVDKYLNDFGYGIDLSGTQYAGKPIYYRPWNSFDSWDTENYGKSIEWKKADHDVKDFFKTGIGWTNNIAFNSGGQNAQVRLALGTFNSSGYMPNSTLDRYTVNLSATANLTKDLRAFADVNYISTKTKGRAETGYGDINPVERFNQWGQRQLDMYAQKEYKNPDGTQRSWNRSSMDDPTVAYSNNPYWDRNMNYQNDKRDRYYGNVGVSWQITSWLRAQGKLNLDNYTFRTQERVAIGSASQSYYREQVRTNSELNAEFLFLVDKTFAKDWRLNATLGGNMMDRNYKMNAGSTIGGLLIPELYTLSNSLTNVATDYKSWKRINSLYGSASLGWRSMLYLDVTLRNDWSSTLPKGKNSYLYPSVSLSWVVSELPAVKEAKWLTFAKVRGGFASVGNDTDPYRTSLTYANFLDSDGYPYHFPPYGLYTLPTTLNNADLKPEMTNSWEVGAELRFLQNRLGLDFTYYSKASLDQIIPVAVSGASGYTYQVLNAGKITNKGVEIFLTAVPVRVKNNFEWTITANFARNRNQVVELYPGIDNLQLGVGPFNISVNAAVGQEYGQLMGTDFVYDENGNKVVGSNGRYLSSAVKSLGSVLPDFNLGIGNEFKIFGFDLRVLIDIQSGGKFFSTTKMWGTYTGILAASAENNIREDGVVIDAMVAKYDGNGNVLYNPDGTAQVTGVNTKNIDAYTWTTDHYNGPAAQNILDANYVKLREITLSYTIPAKLTGPIHNLKIGLFGRNLATWGTAMVGIDPEQSNSSGNIQGIEGAGLPSTRTFGFNIGFNF